MEETQEALRQVCHGFAISISCYVLSINTMFSGYRCREVQILQLLPYALYLIATCSLSWSDVHGTQPQEMDTNGISCYSILSTVDLLTVFRGRDRLRHALKEEIGKFLEKEPSSQECTSMTECEMIRARMLRTDTWVAAKNDPKIFAMRLVWDLDVLVYQSCVMFARR